VSAESKPATPAATAKPPEAALPGAAALSGEVAQILQVLDQVRPYLNQDGGDVEFLSFENGIVNVRLHGACHACPSSLMTLRMGIENALRDVVPSVQEVRNVVEPPAPSAPQGHFQLKGLG
jgi:Fe-S cluster biogenesis protein NfuA